MMDVVYYGVAITFITLVVFFYIAEIKYIKKQKETIKYLDEELQKSEKDVSELLGSLMEQEDRIFEMNKEMINLVEATK